MRVGVRLSNATFSFVAKHPLNLPSKLIIDSTDKRSILLYVEEYGESPALYLSDR